MLDLHVLVEHSDPVEAGAHIFREGEPFEAIAAVCAGTVETYIVNRARAEALAASILRS